MDHNKQQPGGSSSFTENLFGPKDASAATSSSLFSSVFGPSSTGLGRHPSNYNNIESSKKQEFGDPYGSGKPSTPLKKDGGDADPNGSSASRGNWWQGSLYY